MYNVSAGDNMNIDLIKLKNGVIKQIDIDYDYSFSKEELKGTGIISLDNVSIVGSIYKNSINDFVLNIIIDGAMFLPCAVTLKPVEYPFYIEIDEEIEELLKEIEENHKKIENSIDILPIIWENILMEIPMRVVSDEASNVSLSGDGWKLVTEDSNHEEINPELAKLQDLLKEKEV